MQNYLYEDLTYSIRQCLFEVQNDLGVGFDEETYHQALIRKFESEGIRFVSKERLVLRHCNVVVRKFELDFLIEDKVILSLKCVPSDFLRTHYIQLFTELKLWKKRLGLLANFGLPNVKIERFIFHEKALQIEENYDYVKNRVTETGRDILKRVRKALLFISEVHGLGFAKPVVKKLVETELRRREIAFERQALIPIEYCGETIRKYKMRDLLVDKQLVLAVRALQDSISDLDISRVRSYLKAANLPLGLVANYGKTKLEIRGIRSPLE